MTKRFRGGLRFAKRKPSSSPLTPRPRVRGRGEAVSSRGTLFRGMDVNAMDPNDEITPYPFPSPLGTGAPRHDAGSLGKPLKRITVLLVEDSRGDARLIEEYLAEVEGYQFKVENADRLVQGVARLAEGGVDVVLLDLSLPDSRGLDTFLKLHAA